MPNISRITTLDENFKSEFGITDVFDVKRGSQKEVFFIKRNGLKCVLKLFKNFGVRDLRELDIYDRYNNLEGIPKIIDIKKHNNDTIVFEEQIDGDELENICSNYDKNKTLIFDLISKIIDILTPFWLDGIVHRDLKPSNIIIGERNKPSIIDFGIAKEFGSTSITTIGFQPHSYQFTSPEQLSAERDKISYRTDFFSLGIIIYYLYYQNLPFGNTREEIENYFSNKEINLRLEDGCEIKEVLNSLLKFNPSERPSKITKLKNLLIL